MPIIPIKLNHQLRGRNVGINNKTRLDPMLRNETDTHLPEHGVAPAFQAIRVLALLLRGIHLPKHSDPLRIFVSATKRAIDSVAVSRRTQKHTSTDLTRKRDFVSSLPFVVARKRTELRVSLRRRDIERTSALLARVLTASFP